MAPEFRQRLVVTRPCCWPRANAEKPRSGDTVRCMALVQAAKSFRDGPICDDRLAADIPEGTPGIGNQEQAGDSFRALKEPTLNTLPKLLLPLSSSACCWVAAATAMTTRPMTIDERASRANSVAAGITEVQRQLLGESTSPTAPGQLIELTRVIVPVGQQLATHTHPGPQLAVISEGYADLHDRQRPVQVTRAAGTSEAKNETASAGQTIDLKPGDALIEPTGMEHSARRTTATCQSSSTSRRSSRRSAAASSPVQ